MHSKDLREYIEKREKAGDLKRIKKQVDWNLELSHVAKLNEEKGGPVLIYENIKDYKTSVITGVWSTTKRWADELSLGLPPNSTMMQLAMFWADIMAKKGIPPPRVVKKGAVMENVIEGDNVDLFSLPVFPGFTRKTVGGTSVYHTHL